jgi:hypothetical protein
VLGDEGLIDAGAHLAMSQFGQTIASRKLSPDTLFPEILNDAVIAERTSPARNPSGSKVVATLVDSCNRAITADDAPASGAMRHSTDRKRRGRFCERFHGYPDMVTIVTFGHSRTDSNFQAL